MPALFRAACLILVLSLSATATAATRINFAIDWLPSGEMAPLYYGIENGLFEKAGFDVHVTVGRGSSDALTKLATGQVDYAMAGLPALLQARAEGAMPVKAILPIFTSQPDALMVSSASDIESLADLPGKRVATAPFSSSNAVWPIILKDNGVDPDSVTLTKVDPAALNPMLANGVVDAVIAWATNAPVYAESLEQTGKTLRTLRWDAYGYDGYGYTLMTSERELAGHAKRVSRFKSVFQQAIEQSVAHPDEAAAAVARAVKEASLEQVEAQWQIATSFIDTDAKDATESGFARDRLAATWQWVARAQSYTTDALDPADVVADE